MEISKRRDTNGWGMSLKWNEIKNTKSSLHNKYSNRWGMEHAKNIIINELISSTKFTKDSPSLLIHTFENQCYNTLLTAYYILVQIKLAHGVNEEYT